MYNKGVIKLADLNQLQATEAVRIVGSDVSGSEQNPVRSTTNGDLGTVDILVLGGVHGSVIVGTSAVALNVSGSNLSGRKLLNIDNTSNSIIYWGYDSSVTTSSFAGRIFKDQQAQWSASESVTIYVIAGSADNSVQIGEGA